MAFLLPEAGIAAIEGGEEATIPKMAEKSASKSSSLQDLFLYKSMQQPTQAPVIINNSNIQNQPVQTVQQATPIMEPPPIKTKTEAENNIVSIENNNIIKIEQAQISSEANQIQQLQELMDIYETNLSIFHAQLDRVNGYLRTSPYQ